MQNGYLLLAALTYIEENLTEPLDLATLAGVCYCSPSGLRRIFATVFGYSVKEYVTKRRLSRAASDLVHSSESVTEIAMKYQYGSPEAFTRAFARFFNGTPSQYRRKHSFYSLFPRMTVEFEPKGKIFMRKVDISELYDLLKTLHGSYMLCADIRHFMETNNNYGYAIGDKILAEAAKRIEQCLEPEMTVIRVGNDEFLALTGLRDLATAEQLAASITELNEEPVMLQGTAYPLKLRVAVATLPESGSMFQELLRFFNEAVDAERAKELAQKE